jgi:SAM-dependent methyltransferase
MGYRRNLRAVATTLARRHSATILVIGAGWQKKWLDKFFAEHRSIELLYSDVDVETNVDLYCDAHDLPFLDATFDGVIASAVLEHVLTPDQVVSELHRVLMPDGLLYSELPFLQQVHEGAYDFTRFTLSGHRRLLNRFAEVASGVVAGPGTVLSWSLEQFAASCAPSIAAPIMRMAVRVVFFWLKYFDYVFGQSANATDGASCTFFLGTRSAVPTSDTRIIDSYKGSGNTRHV